MHAWAVRYGETIIDNKGSSRGTETYKVTTLFCAPDIDLRHIRSYYTNNIWEPRSLFFAPGPRYFDRLHVYIETMIDNKGSSRNPNKNHKPACEQPKEPSSVQKCADELISQRSKTRAIHRPVVVATWLR